MLGVEHKAGTDAIQLAYARLAEKFHPITGATPDKEKFEAVGLAFEVLSDPDLRRDFDKLKGIGGEEKPKFSGRPFFEAYGRDVNLRIALLCVLYDRRRNKPFTPALSMRHIESIVSGTSEELNFALWYLKQRDLVSQDDKSSLQITTDGMDFLQKNPPDADDVMRYIRGEGAETAAAAESPLAAEPEATPIPAQPEAPPVIDPAIAAQSARIGNLLLARKRQN
ncbi:MAG: hypothetical protein RL328_190 [Acidobacteriota bacterium]